MDATSFQKFLIVFAFVQIAQSVIPGCPQECNCDEFLHGQSVSCSEKNLSVIPTSWPQGTQHIELSHNALTEVTENDFTNDTLRYLSILFLNYNDIRYIQDNAFRNLTLLRKL
jgi:hypothetical protein